MPRDQEKNEPNTQKTVIASNHLSSRRAKLKSNRTLHHESERPEGTANLRQKKQPSSNGRHQDDEQPISSIHHVLQPLDEHRTQFSLKFCDVNEELHLDTLRQWFHSSSFNCRDGLDDYDQDFNVYQPLKDILTADMRHHMERHRQELQNANPANVEPKMECKASLEIPGEEDLTTTPMDVKNVQNQTSTLKLTSSGRVLIIGTEAQVRVCGRRLDDRLDGILLVNSDEHAECQHIRVSENKVLPLIHGKIEGIDGFLGEFDVTLTIHNEKRLVTSLLDLDEAGIDLVMDLDSPPHIQCERPPLGYFTPGNDAEGLNRVMNELPDMVGEFEKSRFIFEAPDLCAHHRSGFRGCSRCISSCPSDAIRSKGDAVEINHFKCQECGLCAAVCPTGALVNGYVQAGKLLNKIRHELQCSQQGVSFNPSVVFHEPETCSRLLLQISSELAGPVIRQSVQDIGSIGMDIWFAALAYGADRVMLVSTPQTTPGMRRAIKKQIGYASTILQGMGYSDDRVVLIDGMSLEKKTRSGLDDREKPPSNLPGKAAFFSPVEDKREMIRIAVQHLYDQGLRTRSHVSLPHGAPFGTIRIAKDTCTFCMACAQICPTSAIESGSGQPQINLIEAQCVQCGMCRKVCPENAIELFPRIVYERKISESKKILNKEAPFNCISCGKPFAPARLIERMTIRLNDHWMYRNQTEQQRLKMCHNCRLQDLFDRRHSKEIR